MRQTFVPRFFNILHARILARPPCEDARVRVAGQAGTILFEKHGETGAYAFDKIRRNVYTMRFPPERPEPGTLFPAIPNCKTAQTK